MLQSRFNTSLAEIEARVLPKKACRLVRAVDFCECRQTDFAMSGGLYVELDS